MFLDLSCWIIIFLLVFSFLSVLAACSVVEYMVSTHVELGLLMSSGSTGIAAQVCHWSLAMYAVCDMTKGPLLVRILAWLLVGLKLPPEGWARMS